MEGIVADVPENLVLMEGEDVYAQWEGYCGYSARLLDNYLLHMQKALSIK